MSDFPPPGYFGLLRELFKNSSFRYLFGFTRKINLLVLIPVFAITALFISGMIDSGWMQQLTSFLTDTLAMLQTYSYRCARTLPNVQAFFRCFE